MTRQCASIDSWVRLLNPLPLSPFQVIASDDLVLSFGPVYFQFYYRLICAEAEMNSHILLDQVAGSGSYFSLLIAAVRGFDDRTRTDGRTAAKATAKIQADPVLR